LPYYQIVASETDWRFDLAKRLKGERLQYKKYHSSRGSDHDHCIACFQKFADWDTPDIVHEGYTTLPDYEFGEDYHWVCMQCFSDFHKIMEWTAD
jgi:hypothetical protein